jgi:predicted ArsR family transcriptional regulator
MARVSDDEIISVFRDAEDPILTAGDVAEAVGVTPQAINSRLHRLNSEGRLETREVGARARVWWLSDSESEE